MTIAIDQAEAVILAILPELVLLEGKINSKGEYLLFDSLIINNAHIGDIDYVFKLYIAINSRTNDRRLAYESIDEALTALVEDWEVNQKVEIGRSKPYSIQGLIVYEIPLTVKGFDHVETI